MRAWSRCLERKEGLFALLLLLLLGLHAKGTLKCLGANGSIVLLHESGALRAVAEALIAQVAKRVGALTRCKHAVQIVKFA